MDMPDRELDALVSEKVMGLHIYSHTWPCGYEPECGCYEAASIGASREYAWHNENGPVFIDQDCDGDIPWLEPVPFYSTDIAAAWRVVEKLQESGLTLHLFREPTGVWKHTNWQAEFYHLDIPVTEREIVEAISPTVARAICLAALKALGVEVDDGR